MFEFLKKIKDIENGKVSDEALKLIVKISEGSVRDALSLLDRGLLSLGENTELDLLNGIDDYLNGRMMQLNVILKESNAMVPQSFIRKYYTDEQQYYPIAF